MHVVARWGVQIEYSSTIETFSIGDFQTGYNCHKNYVVFYVYYYTVELFVANTNINEKVAEIKRSDYNGLTHFGKRCKAFFTS